MPQMNAVRLYGPHDLRLVHEPIPAMGPGEALVRIRSVSVCHSDIHYYQFGRIGDTVSTEPLILGHEFAGEVVAVGDAVQHVHAGDLVAVEPAVSCGQCRYCREGDPNLCLNILFAGTPPLDGALREYAALGGELLFPLPEGFTADDGALLEPLGVAMHAWDLAKARVGDSVAILGCGPIGLLLVQLARLGGAARVLAVEPLENRRRLAARWGAIPVPALEQSVAGDLVSDVERLARLALGDYVWRDHGVDVAIEVAGTLAAQEEAVRLVKRGGTVVLVGIPPEDQVTFPHHIARRKGLTIKMARRMKHTYPRAIELTRCGLVELQPLVTHHFALGEADAAYRLVAGYGDGVIKAMVHP